MKRAVSGNLEYISKSIILEMEGTVLIQSCCLIFYMKNKNIDRFLKAEPNVEPPPRGSVPPTEV